MSTGLECHFYELPSAEWFYLLEEGSAPKQCWDWREYAVAYGPFMSYDVAREHLSRHHANPGGHSRIKLENDAEIVEVLKNAFTDARAESARQKKSYRSSPYRGF
jgi:hypothetical protein